MPQATFTGHPLHPQLIVMPAGLLPFSLVLDLLYLKSHDHSYADAAYYTMAGGFVGGLIAGAAGAADFLTIPDDSPAKRVGRVHGLMNIGLLALTGVNLLMRRQQGRRPGPLPRMLSVIGNAGLFVSAWFGGELVYRHGMRVHGTGLSGAPNEIKPPGDERAAQALRRSIGEAA